MRLRRRLSRGAFILCLSVGLSQTALATTKDTATSDVRIVIDISGSMKKTDPQNLRAPALRLLVKLLPASARAGIWLFATDTQRVAPIGIADAKWRARAESAANKISSTGQFTDIGHALEVATADWKEPEENSATRSVIFLTDGIVDISKDPQKNLAAQEKISHDTIPRLKANKVQIIAIALSKDADSALLKKLALNTGGWFQLAETSEALQKAFFKAFEKAVPRDTVPMEGNAFQIDGAVSEFTLLAFRKPTAPESELLAPDGTKYNEKSNSSQVSWFRQGEYDLITLAKPAAGTWKLIADLDPDNRVMVVTDLTLKTSKFPNNIALGEKVTLQSWLTEKGSTIDRKDFLELVKMEATQEGGEHKAHHSWQLQDNGLETDEKEHDGIFSLALDESLTLGEHTLSLDVDGKTFKRQKQLTFTVHKTPIQVDVKPDLGGATRGYHVTAVVNADIVNPASAKVGLSIKSPHGNKSLMALSETAPGSYAGEVKDLEPTGDYQITPSIKGVTQDGRNISLTLAPIVLAPIEEKKPEEPAPVEHAHEDTHAAPEKAAEPVKEEHEAHHEEAPAAKEEHESHPVEEHAAEEEAPEPEASEELAKEEESSEEHESEEEPAAAEESEAAHAEEAPAEHEEGKETPADPRTQWFIAIGTLVGVNALIVVGCIFGYKAWKRKRLASIPVLESASTDTTPTTPEIKVAEDAGDSHGS